MTPSYILGAGGHAKVVLVILEGMRESVAGLFDEREDLTGTRVLGHEILGPVPKPEWWKAEIRRAFLAIGSNRTRAQLHEAIAADWVRAVHPSAIVHSTARIGYGTMVSMQAIIQPDASIGIHVIINTSAVVEHDCAVGSFVHLGPGSRLCGGVVVEDGVLLGAGSVVIPGVRIGAWSIIGAGSVVVRDVAPGSKLAGNPARPINERTASL